MQIIYHRKSDREYDQRMPKSQIIPNHYSCWRENSPHYSLLTLTDFLLNVGFVFRRADLIVEVAHPNITREFGATFVADADYMVISLFSILRRRRSHCVLSLSKTLYPLLCPGPTGVDPSRHG